jgi:hypothetical protein
MPHGPAQFVPSGLGQVQVLRQPGRSTQLFVNLDGSAESLPPENGMGRHEEFSQDKGKRLLS